MSSIRVIRPAFRFESAFTICAILVCAACAWGQTSLGTEIAYQGRLFEAGTPVSGPVDLRFALYDALAGGAPIAGPLDVLGVDVVEGLFRVDLDFGAAAFDGDARWLQIAVAPAGSGAYEALSPRQPLRAVPYALFALESAGGGGAGDGHSLDAADGSPTDAVYVDNDGFVGIGTTTPAEKLHVSGSTPDVRVEATGSGSVGVQLANTDHEYSVRMTNGENFVLRDVTAGNVDRITILPTGEVGIGTSQPEGALSIANGGTPVGITQGQLGSNGMELTTRDGSGGQPTRVKINAGANASTIEFYSGARAAEVKFAEMDTTSDGGRINLLDSAGVTRVNARGTTEGGQVVVRTPAGADSVMMLSGTSGTGAFRALGPSGNRNVEMSFTAANNDHGWIAACDSTGTAQSQMYVDNGGDGVLTTNSGSLDKIANGGRLILWDDAGVNRVNAQATANGGQVKVRSLNDADRVQMYVNSSDRGVIDVMGEAGVTRVNAQATANGGQVKVRSAANEDRALMYVNSDDSGIMATYGANGSLNAQFTYLAGHPNHGFFGIYDSSGTRQAGMFVNESGDGELECDVLQIFGGSDIAEPFDVAHEREEVCAAIEPGMVVAIDAAHPGQLRVADRAYDASVAGIISGAGGVKPGMTLQQPGTLAHGKHPVAMTGRVWCYVDADANGAVRPGDLLTSSDTPGHAMRATDRQRAFGACIGKAMTALESGQGLVLVLVNLQ